MTTNADKQQQQQQQPPQQDATKLHTWQFPISFFFKHSRKVLPFFMHDSSCMHRTRARPASLHALSGLLPGVADAIGSKKVECCVLYRLWRKLIRVVDIHFWTPPSIEHYSLCLSSPPCARPLLLQLLCVCGLVYERTWLSDGVELQAN